MLNFVITSTALTFQITVLYPWHKQLDESFEALKREHISVAQKLDRFKIHEGKSSSQEQVQVGDILKKEELWFVSELGSYDMVSLNDSVTLLMVLAFIRPFYLSLLFL